MRKSISNKNAFKIHAKTNKNMNKYLDGGYYVEVEVTTWTEGQPVMETIQIFRDCIGTVKAIRL